MIKHPPYAYTLNFSSEIIENVKSWHTMRCIDIVQCSNPGALYNSVYKLAELAEVVFPDLMPYLADTGLVLTLAPGKSTPIHVDNLTEASATRHIALNFPIIMCNSVTEFYPNPMIQISRPEFNNRDAIVAAGTTPAATFSMGEQAVLLNTQEFHKVSNLSKTDTRVLLSCSFKPAYSFIECLDILKSLGYAE